ncbi:phage gp36-like protein [Neisseria sp. HSC-16F19]|nr:phage protein Gp36 family protein [Neisseria sp. HSC-16F19]MCP2041776.1 phage gp36-like protein [Neisseria sp. HSC-16F19]
MSYATVEDMAARFGESVLIQLTDLARRGQVDTAAAQMALDDATAEMDGYLARYTRPFATVPRILTVYCCDIARYRLATGMRQLTDDVQSRYDAAVAYLRLVAKGQAGLSGLPENSAPAADSTVVFAEPQQKVFGRDRPY